MTTYDILESHSFSLYWRGLLEYTRDMQCKSKSRERRDVLEYLEKLDYFTRKKLDEIVAQPHAVLFDPSPFSDDELYMLRCRFMNALDILSRLQDSLPKDDYASFPNDLCLELQWLFVGMWKEFGQYYLTNLAWRISKGSDEVGLPQE